MPAAGSTAYISLLAFASAAQFAAGTLLVNRGLRTVDSVTGAIVQIFASMVLFGVAAIFTLEAAFWLSPAVWVFVGIGLARPSFSTILANEGTRRLGPTVATTVESTSPIFAVIGGAFFLSEHLTPPIMIGTLGVVAGLVVLSSKGRVPRHWPLWAIVLPLSAAIIRSGAHVAAKWGLTMLPSVVMSGFVAYSVSFVIAGGVHVARGDRSRGGFLDPGVMWFALAGATNAGAIFTLNSALMLGQVVLVSPLVATYPLFTLLGARIFYRTEVVTWRTLVGIALTVPSVVVITLWH